MNRNRPTLRAVEEQMNTELSTLQYTPCRILYKGTGMCKLCPVHCPMEDENDENKTSITCEQVKCTFGINKVHVGPVYRFTGNVHVSMSCEMKVETK